MSKHIRLPKSGWSLKAGRAKAITALGQVRDAKHARGFWNFVVFGGKGGK